MVKAGQFVVSKIDGKSGAFGFIPENLDGSVVTQDFMVFDLDKKRVWPPYLELALNDDAILSKFQKASNMHFILTDGSTGRKRLSLDVFLSARIPLPSLSEQMKLVGDIVKMRNEINVLLKEIDARKQNLSEMLYKE